MAQHALTNSFMQELLTATHDFSSDVFYLALYTPATNLTTTLTEYTTTNEITGTGYTAGGKEVENVAVNWDIASGTVWVDFDDVSWTGALTASGALLYNSSKANRTVAVMDFGFSRSSTTTFTAKLPFPTAQTALIRFVRS